MWFGPRNPAYRPAQLPRVPNPIGVNFANTGTGTFSLEGFPTFKNRIHECEPFGTAANFRVPVALTAAGWPAADFECFLFESSTALPAWANGGFSCGFIGTGSETITAVGSTITNVVHGTAGAYSTFTMTPSTSNFGFKVTGTTGGATNIYAYLPAYNTLSGADDWTTPNSLTTECVNFYSKFAYIRFMQQNGSWFWTATATSANRRTPSNSVNEFELKDDIGYPSHHGGVATFNLTVAPGNGATSAILSNAWPYATGPYGAIIYVSTGFAVARVVTLTNGATTCTWSDALTSAANQAYIDIGYEKFPFEVFVNICNACGCGLWMNLPMLEDGTNGSAGTWSTALMTYLASNWTSPGNIYFELGNENWNGSYYTLYMLNDLASLHGFVDSASYQGYRLHALANVARANLPAGWWGTRVFQVLGCQTAAGNGPFYPNISLSYMNTNYGTPSADVQYIAAAPYVTPTLGNTDSIATIEAAVISTDNNAGLTRNLENIAIKAIQYGLGLCSYEDGGQWNAVNQSAVNVGAALLDSGMTASMTNHYDLGFNNGLSFVTHFGAGLNATPGANNGCANEFQLVTNYTSFIANPSASSPTYAAVASYFGAAPTPTRNIVTGSGSVVNGVNYADNSATISNVVGTFNLASGADYSPHAQTGYCPYLIYCSAAGTYALVVTFSGCSGSPVSNVEVNGTVLYTAVACSNGAIAMGNVTLVNGWNYVCLGHNGAQTASVTQLQFN